MTTCREAICKVEFDFNLKIEERIRKGETQKRFFKDGGLRKDEGKERKMEREWRNFKER